MTWVKQASSSNSSGSSVRDIQLSGTMWYSNYSSTSVTLNFSTGSKIYYLLDSTSYSVTLNATYSMDSTNGTTLYLDVNANTVGTMVASLGTSLSSNIYPLWQRNGLNQPFGLLHKFFTDRSIQQNKKGFVVTGGDLYFSNDGSTNITLTPTNSTTKLQYISANEWYLQQTVTLDVAGYKISGDMGLYYDTMLKSLVLHNYRDMIKDTEILLLQNINGNIVAGDLKDYYDNADKVVVNDFPDYTWVDVVTPSNIEWQSFCPINGKMWFFAAGGDNNSGNGQIFVYDPTNLTTTTATYFHNFGHCNTVDYNVSNDCLIFGNGSGSYTLPMNVTIIPNWTTVASGVVSGGTFDYASLTKIVIDLSSWSGSKANAFWGDNNFGQNNIFYLTTNDNRKLDKILLGQGTNNLGSGTLISGKASNEFNGTYKVIGTWTRSFGGDVNNGNTYYKGKIISAVGHDGAWFTINEKMANGTFKGINYHNFWYDSSGSTESTGVTQLKTEGISNYNGEVWLGIQNSRMGIMKFTL